MKAKIEKKQIIPLFIVGLKIIFPPPLTKLNGPPYQMQQKSINKVRWRDNQKKEGKE